MGTIVAFFDNGIDDFSHQHLTVIIKFRLPVYHLTAVCKKAGATCGLIPDEQDNLHLEIGSNNTTGSSYREIKALQGLQCFALLDD